MKITKSQLRQLVKEELDEGLGGPRGRAGLALRQKIVNMLAEYFDVTIGEAELIFRNLEP